MKKILTLLFSISMFLSFSQINDTDETEEIMKVVNNVFEAMRTNDSTLLKSCFVENPSTFTVFKNQEGQTNLATGDFSRFVSAVGQPKEQVWNEPIWNEKVEIDGDLASVWVDYAFYIDDQFLHCGVDAFHLVQKDGTWKIFHLVDTRRKKDCIIPDDTEP
ncbi:MAG: nuclear transport factor 2 family protein [Bacteroidota bacterium]